MIEQGTLEWKQMRLGKVTASRVADILAKTKTGPSASRQNYLIELALQRATGNIEEGYTNDAMQRGVEQEPLARMAYEAKTGVFVDQVPFVAHPTLEWAGMSPDGLVANDGLIEIKNPNSATHWATIRSGEIPGKYITQMTWQLACTDREWNDYISFDSRMPERSQMFVKRLYRDDKAIKEMEDAVRIFLDEVAEETAKIIEGVK